MSRSTLVVRNVVVSLRTQILTWVLSFVVTLYLPRYLGASGLGKLTFAGSFIGMFGVFVSVGTSTVIVKEIARNRARTGELLLAALLLRIPLACGMTAIATLCTHALHYPQITRSLIILSSVGMVIATTNDALSSALQGQENFSRQSVALLVEKFLSSTITVFLIFRRAPLLDFGAIALFTGSVSLAVNLSAFRPLASSLKWPAVGVVQALARAGLPFMGWAVFRNLYGQIDPLVLSIVCNDATIGWYAVACRFVGTALFFPTGLTAALLPTLSRLHASDPSRFQELARRLLSATVFGAIPITLVLLCMPERILLLLHYPPEFVQAVPVLRAGGIAALLYFAACSLGTIVIAADGQRRMFHASIAATILSIPACIAGSYLTQRFWHNGAIGAILSDSAVELVLVCGYAWMLPASIINRSFSGLMGRYLIAGLPLAALLLLIGFHRLQVWVLAPAVALYVGLCYLFGCFTLQDLQIMRGAIKK